jgi:hypothetical protein
MIWEMRRMPTRATASARLRAGVCTLRAAIQEFDALSACTNVINFSVTGTISLSAVGSSDYGPSALLINRATTINGNGVIPRTQCRRHTLAPVLHFAHGQSDAQQRDAAKRRGAGRQRRQW